MSKARGTLVGVAVGDALGAPFEGSPPVSPAELDHALESHARVLRYTDDTAMTIGLATSLLERGRLDQQHLVRTFARDHRAEPWRGYGSTPPRIFRLMEKGVPWRDAARGAFGGAGSFGNGAAMRVAPVALAAFDDLPRVAALAQRSAVVTHAHPRAVEGAVLQATAIAILLRWPSQRVDPPAFLAELRREASAPSYADAIDVIQALLYEAPAATDIARLLGNGVEAHRSVPTAIYCFLRHSGSFRDAMHLALGLGGDTDTIASMTGALAGAALGIEGIPSHWLDATEGVEHVSALADRLLELELE